MGTHPGQSRCRVRDRIRSPTPTGPRSIARALDAPESHSNRACQRLDRNHKKNRQVTTWRAKSSGITRPLSTCPSIHPGLTLTHISASASACVQCPHALFRRQPPRFGPDHNSKPSQRWTKQAAQRCLYAVLMMEASCCRESVGDCSTMRQEKAWAHSDFCRLRR